MLLFSAYCALVAIVILQQVLHMLLCLVVIFIEQLCGFRPIRLLPQYQCVCRPVAKCGAAIIPLASCIAYVWGFVAKWISSSLEHSTTYPQKNYQHTKMCRYIHKGMYGHMRIMVINGIRMYPYHNRGCCSFLHHILCRREMNLSPCPTRK